jgi:hypothetical protein
MDEVHHLSNSDNAHIDKRFDEVLVELKKIHGAFAIGDDGTTDFDGHRRFHEEKVRAAKAEAEFWSELKMEIAKKGIWSLLVIVCGLVVVGLSAKIGLTR